MDIFAISPGGGVESTRRQVKLKGMSAIEKQAKQDLLKILHRQAGSVSSGEATRQLTAAGFRLSPRTVRLYLQRLQDEGLVERARRGRGGGRGLTPRGVAEIEAAGGVGRLGFMVAKIERMAYRMTYHPRTNPQGTVILNVTLVEEAAAVHALREMAVVLQAGLGTGDLVGLFPAGTCLPGCTVPARCFGIGTVCSVTFNGVLMQAGIPVASEFGAVLELRDREPWRFTDLVAYSGTTLDPLEIFIKAGLTQVHAAAITGNGRIGASFRQFPAEAQTRVEEIRQELREAGLDGVIGFGQAGRPFLEFPVHEGRTAVLVAGGLNPAAAVEEAGIETRSSALAVLCPASRLIHYRDMQARAFDLMRSGADEQFGRH